MDHLVDVLEAAGSAVVGVGHLVSFAPLRIEVAEEVDLGGGLLARVSGIGGGRLFALQTCTFAHRANLCLAPFRQQASQAQVPPLSLSGCPVSAATSLTLAAFFLSLLFAAPLLVTAPSASAAVAGCFRAAPVAPPPRRTDEAVDEAKLDPPRDEPHTDELVLPATRGGEMLARE